MTRITRLLCAGVLALALCATTALAQTDTTGAATSTSTMSTPKSTTTHAKHKVHRRARRKKSSTTKTAYHPSSAERKEHVNKKPHAFVSRVNINTASREELMRLPDVTADMADKIIAGRPYGSGKELVAKGILTDDEYKKIEHRVSAKLETK